MRQGCKRLHPGLICKQKLKLEMTTVLSLDSFTFNASEIIPLLTNYQLIPQLLCEQIIDRAIAPIECTPSETEQALQEFYQRWGLINETQQQEWQKRYGLNRQQLEALATRRLRVEKFKELTWGAKITAYFLKRKRFLDHVIYWFMQFPQEGIAYEIYFRLQEGEQSFEELTCLYSQNCEVKTGGLIGPVELGSLPEAIGDLIFRSHVGQVQLPRRVGNSWVIVQLEKLIPAQLDSNMYQRLLQEQFEMWFQSQLQKLSKEEKIWMGVNYNPDSAQQNVV